MAKNEKTEKENKKYVLTIGLNRFTKEDLEFYSPEYFEKLKIIEKRNTKETRLKYIKFVQDLRALHFQVAILGYHDWLLYDEIKKGGCPTSNDWTKYITGLTYEETLKDRQGTLTAKKKAAKFLDEDGSPREPKKRGRKPKSDQPKEDKPKNPKYANRGRHKKDCSCPKHKK
jgi:hypothetical protein